jgi:hypothetical protein
MTEQEEQPDQAAALQAAPQVNCETLVVLFNVMQKILESLVKAQQKQTRKNLDCDAFPLRANPASLPCHSTSTIMRMM